MNNGCVRINSFEQSQGKDTGLHKNLLCIINIHTGIIRIYLISQGIQCGFLITSIPYKVIRNCLPATAMSSFVLSMCLKNSRLPTFSKASIMLCNTVFCACRRAQGLSVTPRNSMDEEQVGLSSSDLFLDIENIDT